MRWQAKVFNWLILTLGLYLILAFVAAVGGMIPFKMVFFSIVLLAGTIYIGAASNNL